MFNVLILGLLLLYYWYFYSDFSKPVPKPSTGAPLPAESLKPQFDMQLKHQFTVKVNGQVKWHHMLPKERYVLSNQKIIPRDVCYGVAQGRKVEASGPQLYHYLKNRPDTSLDALSFRDTPYTVQTGKVYYFTCSGGRIERLHICPSGTIFRNGNCVDINMCTGKPDGTRFAGSTITTYFKCKSGRESRHESCPDDLFFYHDRCVRMDDLAHWCAFYSNAPLLLDEKTRVDCRNGKPVRTECAPGYRFFDLRDYCESDRCVGQPDYAKLPLPDQEVKPFRFKPGYWECLGGRVSRTVECPQTWDDSLSRGENLTFLPMVFSGTECSVPEFGTNVFSDDPDVLVPVYEFTKHLRNWESADSYDRAAGYDQSRKRRVLPPGARISKRFKVEDACATPGATVLPVFEQPKQYYHCGWRRVVDCPGSQYFNGAQCVPEPENAFKFKGIPIFSFDSLNFESWIVPPEYSNARRLDCDNFEPALIPLYNICSHPDCTPYAFLSMIPDLALFLPSDQSAKCRYDESSRRLVKEEVRFPYSFWSQKLSAESGDACTPGQSLSTGNFIWDSTVFATCDPSQPFVFCPSVHSGRIELYDNRVYACAPPATNRALLNTVDWTPFAVNEVKRVLPDTWTGNPQYVKFNRKDHAYRDLPQDGLEIPPGTKTNLHSRQPIQVEFRLRATYPPNVAFEYDDHQVLVPRIAPATHGFLAKLNDFTIKPLRFPRYQFQSHVESLKGPHLV